MSGVNYSAITPEIFKLADLCVSNNVIDPELYNVHQVKRGLRDLDGKGVVTGLTEVSSITSSKNVGGVEVPCDGVLCYRGIDINQIVEGVEGDGRQGFEEVVYLLLFGKLPTKQELDDFFGLIASYRKLPSNFIRDVIMKAPSEDIMNSLSRSVLTLASYDKNANDVSIPNVLRQSIQLIANFPSLVVYSYKAYRHYLKNDSLVIHSPSQKLSTAENFLRMLREDMKYTELEAKILDLALILHAEHGGGNNSTFTTHVVTSSGTDTYSSITASLCSLKGPKHGGANVKVKKMFDDMKKNVSDWKDDEEISRYLEGLLDKERFDKAGLIYGMGHAVYSISDPRTELLKKYVRSLSEEKGRTDEFELYSKVAYLAPQVIGRKRKIYKGVSPNVDFYSGFVYTMLDLPEELYTPLFAIARIAGWSAHRIEELINANKIIRPAYKSVVAPAEYVPLDRR